MKSQIWKKMMLVLAIVIMITGAFLVYHWVTYEEPKVLGAHLVNESGEEMSLSDVTESWFEEWASGHKGWKVPFSYRLKSAKIISLDELGDGYIEVHYEAEISGVSEKVVENLELISTDTKNLYHGQWVLKWNQKGNGWSIAKVMTPTQYQMQTQEFQAEINEPQVQHFALNTDEKETYYVKDDVLYVTYDGENFTEVPDGYELVCGTTNGTYDEYLPKGSYVVNSEFTAFVGYTTYGASLIYSTDAGQTWSESKILDMGYRANTFLSKTESYCYASFAVDRTGGHDYYGTYRTADFVTWERVPQPMEVYSGATCIYWQNDSVGYYSAGESGFYRTTDGGATYELFDLPEYAEIAAKVGCNPYDNLERMYQEDGVIYMVIGQGDDGDYAKEGRLLKALFQSTDGIYFTFVEEIDDNPVEAG